MSGLLPKLLAGDPQTVDAFCSRCLLPLQRWAKGRVPAWARDLADAEGLVEEILMESLDPSRSKARSSGPFQTQLRQRILNRIREEVHRVSRQSESVHPSGSVGQASLLEKAVGRKTYDLYERALSRLTDDDREDVIARVELNLPYPQVAQLLGKSNSEEARTAVIGALYRLAEEMKGTAK